MSEPVNSPVAVVPVAHADADSDLSRLDIAGGSGESGLAQAAVGDGACESQNAFLASLEARLAEEMRGLICSLGQFSSRAQQIGKLLPDDANFGKTITGLLSLISLQLAYSLSESLNKPIFLDEGAEYLRGLGLTMEQTFREFSFDGRRYCAVACADDGLNDVRERAGGGEEC